MYVRDAQLDDANDLSLVYQISWKTAYKDMVPDEYLNNVPEDHWTESFKTWIKSKELKVTVILDEEKIIGGIVYGKAREEKLSNCGEIISLYVLPQYFGKGAGKLLMDCAINNLRFDGYSKAYIWVLDKNIRAQKFYKKYNFYETKDKYIDKILDKEIIDLRFVNEDI